MAEFNENVDKNDFNKTPIYSVFDIKSDENNDHKIDPYEKKQKQFMRQFDAKELIEKCLNAAL